MSRFIARIFVLLCLSGLSVSAQPAVTDIGPIEIQSQLQTLSVRVTASPEELNRLANLAFEVHGRYRRVTSNPSFDIRFTAVSGNRVQVDVARGNSRVNRAFSKRLKKQSNMYCAISDTHLVVSIPPKTPKAKVSRASSTSGHRSRSPMC